LLHKHVIFNQVDGPSSHKTPSPSSSSHLRAAHESVPSFTLPNRSSTPEFYRPDVARHGTYIYIYNVYHVENV